ncbi:MAG TPA: hypothetical protein VE440_04445 [Gaiellaceae bacterium]|nr:hypothetical protein [Gaiellaceae bacterium]
MTSRQDASARLVAAARKRIILTLGLMALVGAGLRFIRGEGPVLLAT